MGLRASEVCGLRWDQVELDSGRLHIRRAKGGIDNAHPLSGREIRALRQLRRENMESRYVFVTERGGPATTAGFLKMISRTGEAAKLQFPVHPHMLRHATGYARANNGVDTRASSTSWVTVISSTRFDTPKWRLIGSRISGRTKIGIASGPSNYSLNVRITVINCLADHGAGAAAIPPITDTKANDRRVR
jgi:hypothetical protein